MLKMNQKKVSNTHEISQAVPKICAKVKRRKRETKIVR